MLNSDGIAAGIPSMECIGPSEMNVSGPYESG